MPDKFHIGFSFKLGGPDYDKFKNFISFNWRSKFEKELDMATGRAARYIRAEIRKRILDRQYVPNSLFTARRKGYETIEEAIPLVDTGGLIREALMAQRLKKCVWEVGVIGEKPSRKTGYPAKAYVRALHDGYTGTATIGGRTITYRIPPRPFLRSVWADLMVQNRVHKEWRDAIEKVLKENGKL